MWGGQWPGAGRPGCKNDPAGCKLGASQVQKRDSEGCNRLSARWGLIPTNSR